MIIMVVTPFILSTFIYNANTFIDQTLYQKLMMDLHGLTDAGVAAHTGIVGKAVKVSNIPIALSSAMASALIPVFPENMRKESERDKKSGCQGSQGNHADLDSGSSRNGRTGKAQSCWFCIPRKPRSICPRLCLWYCQSV